jgi:hypothetical protein
LFSLDETIGQHATLSLEQSFLYCDVYILIVVVVVSSK